MRFPGHRILCAACTLLLACLPCASLPQPNRDKTVWNYEGGIFFATDGSIPNGPCFRIAGRVNAPKFFDEMKRIDTDTGTTFRSGEKTVTHFPGEVLLSFVLRDMPCSSKLDQPTPITQLTRAQVGELRLSLFWKRGIAMRPATGVEKVKFTVIPVVPYATTLAHDLPEKLEWVYELAVPSADVPLTDSLVLVVRTPDDRIAARVAARM